MKTLNIIPNFDEASVNVVSKAPTRLGVGLTPSTGNYFIAPAFFVEALAGNKAYRTLIQRRPATLFRV